MFSFYDSGTAKAFETEVGVSYNSIPEGYSKLSDNLLFNKSTGKYRWYGKSVNDLTVSAGPEANSPGAARSEFCKKFGPGGKCYGEGDNPAPHKSYEIVQEGNTKRFVQTDHGSPGNKECGFFDIQCKLSGFKWPSFGFSLPNLIPGIPTEILLLGGGILAIIILIKR